ncbi:MAG: 50S ribosomal protein L4 [Alphaproteobacteria bacterium]|nr:50S ribosomal protein L4 [Pseudomonadota bacterium]TDI64200.1 MAG: 50S ribosomal protein L4 [Alphaproteobacteria bacterium]
MKVDVINLDAKNVGSIDLADEVFGAEVRNDLLQRCVEWQRAKRRAGTHKVKVVSEIRGTTAKPHRQKGTGRARAGSLRSTQFRGGATMFGPVVRSHAYKLPKKVRKAALRSALSAKQAAGELVVLDEAKATDSKTKALAQRLGKLGWGSVLIIDGATVDAGFSRAARNIPGVDLLPSAGANVYDILHSQTLVLTKEAVSALEARLK